MSGHRAVDVPGLPDRSRTRRTDCGSEDSGMAAWIGYSVLVGGRKWALAPFSLGRVTPVVWGAKAIRPLSCAIAISLLVISFPAWSGCNEPDRTPTSRYTITGGEVYDTQTRLIWARCSVGQVWTEGEGCVGTIRDLTFEQAKQRVDALWRLPTGKELVTLVAFCQHPAINTEVFPNMNMPLITLYWADAKDSSDFPNVVDFYFGGTTVLNRAETAAVRLVRR
jgi:hypothetical protein